MRATLKSKVTFAGVGLHTGEKVTMTVNPASAQYGIWFRRTDIESGDAMVQAIYTAVDEKPLCTRLINSQGVEVGTVEHIMAALAGCGIHNALIEIDGPEVPILDGCAATFVKAFIAKGLRQQNVAQHALEILKPVVVQDGEAIAMLTPAAGLEIDFQIDFEDRAIGKQHRHLSMANGTFVRELADSRTFCRKADIDRMHAAGLALGGTYENAVVVDDASVLSPGGLRHADEAVRHKMLDALGDLALAGAPILGRYSGLKAGHAMTNRLLRKLFATPGAYRVVSCTADQQARLPGAGVKHADLALVA